MVRLLLVLIPVLSLACGAPPRFQVPWASEQAPSAEEVPQEDLVLSGRPATAIRRTPAMGDWRIAIPAIGIDATIVSVGLDPDGAMGSPDGPHDVGWYKYGPVPGEKGNVLLDGHVDWTNRQTGVAFGAVFWDLKTLKPGTKVTITDGEQEFVYQVTEYRRYRWDDPEGVSVLQPTQDPRITMITCGGQFDRASRNYSMREVVIAELVS